MSDTITYTILVERGPNNLSAYIPDVPGCVAVGETEEEVVRLLQEAATDHIALMIEDGEAVPEATLHPASITVLIASRV